MTPIPGDGQFKGYALGVVQTIPIGFSVSFYAKTGMAERGPNGEPHRVSPPPSVTFQIDGSEVTVLPSGFESFGGRGSDGEPLSEATFVREAGRAISVFLSGNPDDAADGGVAKQLTTAERAFTTLGELQNVVPKTDLHFVTFRGLEQPTNPDLQLTVRCHQELKIAFVTDDQHHLVAVLGTAAKKALFGA